MEFIIDVFQQWGLSLELSTFLSRLSLFFSMIVLSILANYITKAIVLKILTHYITNNKYQWDNIMLEHKVFQRLSHVVPALIIFAFAHFFPTFEEILIRLTGIYLIVIFLYVLDALLNAVNAIYKTYEVSKSKPIKSYLQVIKIFFFAVGSLLALAALMDKSPAVLLGGIGAMTAVFMLVFRDSILGLVAGIQLTANDMVRIGDWIEMPKYGANGDVIDITLNTVKVENFDMTITTIPTYALIADSFINWRGVSERGGRRIMRQIMIDMTSIQFCDEEMLKHLTSVNLISDYIVEKAHEIQCHNAGIPHADENPVNGRRLTNVGIFRAYTLRYLENHPHIHQDMIKMVRQMPPNEFGLPLQLYAFTNNTNWEFYEGVQADIFDHLLAVIPQFQLKVYQRPSTWNFPQP